MTNPAPRPAACRLPNLAEVYDSVRMPLVVVLGSAAVWLVASSVFGLLASLQFHKPQMFGNCAWLLYGRVQPASNNAFLYGFCLQAAVGVALWLIARLGRALTVQPLPICIGAMLWNLGVTVGVVGILAGDATGYENFDMPSYAAPFLFLGFMVMAVFAVMTFHGRVRETVETVTSSPLPAHAPLKGGVNETASSTGSGETIAVRGIGELYPSQWFLLAGFFWFAWIFSTAALMLLVAPDRGMGQAVTAWWYSNNLQVVCFGLFGIGILFYFILRLTRQNLRSRTLALLSFWFLMVLGSWGGIPNSASVPAWIPTISSVMTVLMVLPMITVGLNVYGATRKVFPKPYFYLLSPALSSEGREGEEPAIGGEGREEEAPTVLRFLSVSLLALLAFTVLNAMVSFRTGPQWLTFGADVTDFTWFVPAKAFLNAYGFFAMAIFGAIYYIVPTLFPGERLCPKMVKVHFGLAAAGIVLWFLPLALGGVLQGFELRNGATPFVEIMKHEMIWLRVSTVGILLLLGGHAAFVLNTGGMAVRFYRARAVRIYADATARMEAVEGRI